MTKGGKKKEHWNVIVLRTKGRLLPPLQKGKKGGGRCLRFEGQMDVGGR